jgi:hypothetical protein
MSICRVTSLASGIRFQAKSVPGVWRRLGEGDSIENGESLKVLAGGAHFGDTVCRIQNRVSGAWADAIAITLDLANGTSHTRTDKFVITGDETDSAVSVSLTTAIGHLSLKRAHLAQIAAENKRGITFEWNDLLWSGVVSEISRDKEPVQGGFLEGADARLVANRAQFVQVGVMPVDGNPITIEGDRFAITELDVSDTIYTFALRRNSNA